MDIALGPFSAEFNLFKAMHVTPAYDSTTSYILSGMVHAFETKAIPYTRAFDSHTWVTLWSSFFILIFLLIAGESVLLGKKITFSSVADIIYIMTQTLLQEATKKRSVGRSTICSHP